MINSVLKNKIYIFLAVVILVAGILRFYEIDQVPVSLYWDEVSIGYNAHSIAETGRDEFGESFPLLFRAFEDYKTPGYIYLTSVSVKAFGLNEFSVRFPSALLGTLTILGTYLLVKELIRRRIYNTDPEYIALLTALLISVSPWHIQFSRGGFEANSALFFIVFGAFLFFKFVNSTKYKFLFFSMLFYSISFYFYRSAWIFVPLFLTSVFLIYHKLLFSKKNIKKTSLSITLFFLIVIPFIPSIISSEGMSRTSQTGLVNNLQEEVYQAALKQEETGAIGRVIYNRRLVYISEGAKGYVSHFSPDFLFLEGDGNGRHGVSGKGLIFIWGILFIIPGLLVLTRIDKKVSFSILAWLLISPIPAALSVPTPHALRSLNMIPIPQLLISLGIIWFLYFISSRFRNAAIAVMIGIGLFFLVDYLNIYYNENAKKTAEQWADGNKQLTEYVFENEKDYEKVLISGHYWQPYIYFLFYKQYDPREFQITGKKDRFDNYIFGGTSWDMNGKELGDQNLEEVAGTDNYLVALSPIEFEGQKDNLRVIKEIRNVNNELVFIIAEKNE